MVEGNASMYLGSPRMAEKVIGEKVTLEEMGGARMHCTISGCGDVLATSEEEAINEAKRYLSYFPANYTEKPKKVEPKKAKEGRTLEAIIPENQNDVPTCQLMRVLHVAKSFQTLPLQSHHCLFYFVIDLNGINVHCEKGYIQQLFL